MTKSISAGLESHLGSETTTVATCWKITLTNGTIKAFTDHDVDITFNGVTYLSSSGYTASAVQTSGGFNVDNLEVQGFLSSPSITSEELLSGLWDYAEVEIFQVNYNNLSQGALSGRFGTLGEIKTDRSKFNAELRGMMQAFSRNIGQLYSASCRADLGDSRCTVNLASFTASGSVDSVTGNRVITDADLVQASGYFDYGKVTFTSGLNNGLSMEVKSYVVGVLTLQLEMPNAIAPGDTYTVHAGCAKRLIEDCKNRFNNVVNFRGEPYLPGQDQIVRTGGT